MSCPKPDVCDLCRQNDADELFQILLPEERGYGVYAICWRCRVGVADELLDELVASVLLGGNSPKLAAMLVTQQVPTIHTNDTFGARWRRGGEQFASLPKEYQEEYARHAKKAGVTIHGRQYMSGLADYPGDPRAWVANKDEAIAVLKERGYGCERLGVKAKVTEGETKEVPLADDIVQRHVNNYLADVPRKQRTPKMLEETRERVIETHGRKKDSGVSGVHLPQAGWQRKPRKNKRA